MFKQIAVSVLVGSLSLPVFADPASEEVKLVLLMANPALLADVNVAPAAASVKSEDLIKGDESFSTVVKVVVEGKLKVYVVTRDGGGQLRSVVLAK